MKYFIDQPPEVANATWGVMASSSDGKILVKINEAKLLKTASVGKIFLLLEVAIQADLGILDLNQITDIKAEPKIFDSGLLQFLSPNKFTINDLSVLVGAVSDNWATNVLINIVSLEKIQLLAEKLNRNGSTLLDKIREFRTDKDIDSLSIGSAAEMHDLIQLLDSGELINEKVSNLVKGWLSLNVDTSMVANSINLDPLNHSYDADNFNLFNKTGSDYGIRADVGVVKFNHRSVSYAVTCNFNSKTTTAELAAILNYMRDIGSAIRDFLDSSSS